MPATCSMTKNTVPVTSARSVSSTTATVRGTGIVPARAVMTRCSRRMSCALDSTCPSGGRRTTSGSAAPSTR
jgi:hypothetical protein